MADEDFGDEYGDYFFDEDYLYIEDDYAIADELAEGQVPSPGYSGTNAELAAETYEWDNYEFWSDLAYGSDSYFDPVSKSHRKKEKSSTADSTIVERGHKRKRASISTSITRDKRRRITIQQHNAVTTATVHPDNVIFRGDQSPVAGPPTPKSMESFALLPDWKTQFPADADISWQAPMPEDMKRAAEGDDEGEQPIPQTDVVNDEPSEAASPVVNKDQVVKSRKHKARRHVQPVEEHEDQEIGGALASIDPDALRMILRQKLGDTGMEEGAFMSVIQSMLAGGAADDAAEKLTQALLQSEGDDSSAAMNWLGQQGVKIDVGDEEEQDDSEASGKRVDSGAGVPATSLTSHKKRKSKADPGTSSVEASPTKERRTLARSARKKTKP